MFAKFAQISVGIAGCGGLGSNCAVSLARTGIGKLVIVDFDRIEPSNLNRQYFFYDQIGQPKALALKTNIQKINPQTEVIAYNERIRANNVASFFKNCPIIVEAFDRAEEKKMLIETVLENFPEKFIVSGSGLAGIGNNNSLKTVCFGKLYICGDLKSEVSAELPPLAPRVGIVANMQANQVLEIILNYL